MECFSINLPTPTVDGNKESAVVLKYKDVDWYVKYKISLRLG